MEQEPWGSPKFVEEQFTKWYRKNAGTIPAPSDLPRREFAFLTFGGRGMRRHMQLPKSSSLLLKYLKMVTFDLNLFR